MPTIKVDCCSYPNLCPECEERMRRYYEAADAMEEAEIRAQLSDEEADE